MKYLFTFTLLFSALLVAQPADAQRRKDKDKGKEGPAVPVFENGQAQVVEAFKSSSDWIRHDLFVETEFDSDGDGAMDRMHVSVTRPKQTDTEGLKLPVIYVTSPYFAGVAADDPAAFWDVRHNLGETPPEHVHPEVKRMGKRPIISDSHISKWVPRGYIVVHSSSPGTGFSQGAPTIGGENESLAPKAVIDWLCGRAKGFTEPTGGEPVLATWSTGRVGMTGTSYNGTLPIAAATTGVEGLEAIIPIAPNTSYYHYYRSNGLVRHPGGYLGEDIDVLYDFVHSGDESKRARNNEVVRDTEMANGQDRVTGDYNDFWAKRDYLNHMDKFKTPLLMSHGFNDWNVMPEHSYRIYEAAREKGVPCQIYYHQGGHGGPPPITLMNRWFTRYLHNVENGVEDDAKAWIVHVGDKMSKPTSYADYPNPDAKDVILHLGPGAPGAGHLNTTAPQTAGNEVLTDNYSFSGSTLAQADYTDHRLLYVSPTLTKDLHISGTASIRITASSDKAAANLSVWVVSLPWTDRGRSGRITDNIITRGWADLQNRESLTESKPLVPGEMVEMTFTLQPDDQIIPAGQQIGLMIMSSDKDFTLHPDPGTKLTINLDETSLTLPVVGGVEAFDAAVGQ